MRGYNHKLHKVLHMLWLSFIPELNNIFLCFKFVVRHYYSQKTESVNQDKIKLKPHNIKLI